MRTTDHIERFRITDHPQKQFSTTAADGMNGCFEIDYALDLKIRFIAIVSDGSQDNKHEVGPKIEWEHVSVRARSTNGKGKHYERVPNRAEMCWIKDLFWNPDEVVVQFHPAKENYVNIHPNVLHLWRWTGGDMPTPPKICV